MDATLYVTIWFFMFFHAAFGMVQGEFRSVVPNLIGMSLFVLHSKLFGDAPSLSLPSIGLFAAGSLFAAYALWQSYAASRPEKIAATDFGDLRRKIIGLLDGDMPLSEAEKVRVYGVLDQLQNSKGVETYDADFVNRLVLRGQESGPSSLPELSLERKLNV